MTMTVQADIFFARCKELFANYPLAINWRMRQGVRGSASIVRTITLERWDGDRYRYSCVLHCRQSDNSVDVYAMGPFPADDATIGIAESGLVAFNPDRSSYVPDFRDHFVSAMPEYLEVLDEGMPMPREASLFGYFQDGIVTFMLQASASGGPFEDSPSWRGFQLRGSATPDFFASDIPFGPTQLQLFWGHVSNQTIAPLDRLIADSSEDIWWVRVPPSDTHLILVSDQVGPIGRGVYETPPSAVPDSLDALLARRGKVNVVKRMKTLTDEIDYGQGLMGSPLS